MTDIIITKNYNNIPVNRKEIYRYAGCKTVNKDFDALIDEGLAKADDKISFRICYGIFSVQKIDIGLDLGFAVTDSENLMKNLDGCDKIILFGATLGMEFEKLLNLTSLLSPAKALILHAIGDERIESLCDYFNDEITCFYKKNNKITKPRFSPGYGDLPLSLQKDIAKALSLSKNLGISLGDNLFMTPSKSVTAIIGIADRKG